MKRMQMLVGAILALVLGAACVAGTLPGRIVALVLLIWVVLYVFTSGASLRFAVVLSSIAVTLILTDVFVRIFMPGYMFFRPNAMFIVTSPERPYVQRYMANRKYDGMTYGDLAAMSGKDYLREPRHMFFFSDAYGFRNRPEIAEQPSDMLVLGDSFASGVGSSQDSTWASLLACKHGIRNYVLAFPGSPWQQLIDLKMEFQRLNLRPHATVLLALFSGNDLDETYGPSNKLSDLPANGLVDSFLQSLDTFRRRSPIRRLGRQLRWRAYKLTNENQEEDSPIVVKPFLSGRDIAFYKDYVAHAGRSAEELRALPKFSRFISTLDDLTGFCREHELHLKMVVFPSKPEVYRWVVDEQAPWSTSAEPTPFSSIVVHYCEEHHVPCLDLTPHLVKISHDLFLKSGRILWWYDDSHISHLGHRVVAGLIYEHLLRPSPMTSVSERHHL